MTDQGGTDSSPDAAEYKLTLTAEDSKAISEFLSQNLLTVLNIPHIRLILSANRLKRLAGNLERLGLSDACETIATDLFKFAPQDGFDAVLLDAPCSSTGTVRRHPDVPFAKSAADIEKLAALQARMLDTASSWVRPGGVLVFSNCSLDPLEGEAVARRFAAAHPDFAIAPVMAEEAPGFGEAIDEDGFLRLTPAHLDLGDPALSGVDGFFAARFQRLA